MHSGLLVALLFGLVSVLSALYVPYYDQEAFYNAANIDKRTFLGYNKLRQDKREFNADDLTLRFGKRSEPSSFQPEQLSLRFGRR